jgi:hypothetical protein
MSAPSRTMIGAVIGVGMVLGAVSVVWVAGVVLTALTSVLGGGWALLSVVVLTAALLGAALGFITTD